MKKIILLPIITFIAAPAWADLSWSTSTTWNEDAIASALASVNADNATIQNFNARWRAMTNKTVNGAYMGALYAASLDGDVSPTTAVNSGYNFMKILLGAQSGKSNGNETAALEMLVTENIKKVCLAEITKTLATKEKKEIVEIDDTNYTKCNMIDPAPGVVAAKQSCTGSIFYNVAASVNDVDIDMYQCVASYLNPTVSSDGVLTSSPTVRIEFVGETKKSASDSNTNTEDTQDETPAESDNDENTGDENKTDESNGGTSANASISDATDMLRVELDTKCSQLNVLKTFVPASGKLDCARVGDTDAFQCNYSRKYNSSNGIRHLICTTHNKPFTAHFSSDGKSLLDNNAVIGAFEDNAGENKQTAEQNTPTKELDVDVSIADAEIAVAGACRGTCDMSMMPYRRRGEYSITKNQTVCKKRGGKNEFECKCLFTYGSEKFVDLTCTTGFAGTVRVNGAKYYTDGRMTNTQITDYDIGEIRDVQPMAQINPFDTKPELIPAHEKTKKEIRQETREINKQLREIERAEKAEQKAAKKAAKTAPAESVAPVVPVSLGVDVPVDNLGDLDPALLGPEYVSEVRYY